MAMFSFYNYVVNIRPKYYPISKAENLLYDASDAYTAEEKAWCIQEATRLYLQEAQTNDKPLLIELNSLTSQNTTEEFRKVSSLFSDEFEERAFDPYLMPGVVVVFTVAGGLYLALGKYKHWGDKQKTFAFTLVGTLELCLLIFVML